MTTAGPTPEAMPDKNPDATSDANASLRDFSGLIALIGAGKMGGALLEGWLRLGLDPRKIAVLEPEPLPHIAALASRGVRLNPDALMLRQADVVVIAIKPQAAAQVLRPLAVNVSPSALIVSIMALSPLTRTTSTRPLRFSARTKRPSGSARMPSGPSIGCERSSTVAPPALPSGLCLRHEGA